MFIERKMNAQPVCADLMTQKCSSQEDESASSAATSFLVLVVVKEYWRTGRMRNGWREDDSRWWEMGMSGWRATNPSGTRLLVVIGR